MRKTMKIYWIFPLVLLLLLLYCVISRNFLWHLLFYGKQLAMLFHFYCHSSKLLKNIFSLLQQTQMKFDKFFFIVLGIISFPCSSHVWREYLWMYAFLLRDCTMHRDCRNMRDCCFNKHPEKIFEHERNFLDDWCKGWNTFGSFFYAPWCAWNKFLCFHPSQTLRLRSQRDFYDFALNLLFVHDWVENFRNLIQFLIYFFADSTFIPSTGHILKIRSSNSRKLLTHTWNHFPINIIE